MKIHMKIFYQLVCWPTFLNNRSSFWDKYITLNVVLFAHKVTKFECSWRTANPNLFRQFILKLFFGVTAIGDIKRSFLATISSEFVKVYLLTNSGC